MAEGHETLCFTCGLPAGEEARLNHLPNGQVCPACRDRLLETLPAPFPVGGVRDQPSAGGTLEAQEHAPEAVDSLSEPGPGQGELVHLPRSTPPQDYRPEPA